MPNAIAILTSELPALYHEGLERRLYKRGGAEVFRFYFRDREPLLPVWFEGQLQLLRWGSKNRKGVLPCTGWAALLSLEEGKWSQWRPEPVDIPANYIFEGGVWTQLKQGMRGIVVRDATDTPIVYVLCEPPTRYWRVMTRSDRKPLFINEVI
jgi:hypothetical protein